MEPILQFNGSAVVNILIGVPTTINFEVLPFEAGYFSVTLMLPKTPPLVFVKDGIPCKSITEEFSVQDSESEFDYLPREMKVTIYPYNDGAFAQRMSGYAINSQGNYSIRRILIINLFNA